MSPSGKALVFGTSIRGFKSLHPSQIKNRPSWSIFYLLVIGIWTPLGVRTASNGSSQGRSLDCERNQARRGRGNLQSKLSVTKSLHPSHENSQTFWSGFFHNLGRLGLWIPECESIRGWDPQVCGSQGNVTNELYSFDWLAGSRNVTKSLHPSQIK